MPRDKTEKEVWFSGRVQGVGFRYETLKVAKGFEVTGFVENLADGRVHLLAQGTPSEVNLFVESVADRLSDYIRGQEEQIGPIRCPLRSFEIRR